MRELYREKAAADPLRALQEYGEAKATEKFGAVPSEERVAAIVTARRQQHGQ